MRHSRSGLVYAMCAAIEHETAQDREMTHMSSYMGGT